MTHIGDLYVEVVLQYLHKVPHNMAAIIALFGRNHFDFYLWIV